MGHPVGVAGVSDSAEPGGSGLREFVSEFEVPGGRV
jgi:hypothetical protein